MAALPAVAATRRAPSRSRCAEGRHLLRNVGRLTAANPATIAAGGLRSSVTVVRPIVALALEARLAIVLGAQSK